VPIGRRPMQRRATAIVLGIDLGLGGQQRRRYVLVAFGGRPVQGGAAAVIVFD
jgi:hypothetical protein